MKNSETISVIVPAAGCGARAALNGNKILAPLRGETVLFWTLGALCRADFAGAKLLETIVVARPEEFAALTAIWRRCAQNLDFQRDFHLVAGGASRQDSVWEGVKAARGDLVLVHDAARPCVSGEVIARVVAAARQSGAALAAMPVSDTVKLADEAGQVAQTLNRNLVWLAQTPQVFRRDWFVLALESARSDEFEGTDCASILERAGRKVTLVEGEASNLKITFAADLERAAAILAPQSGD